MEKNAALRAADPIGYEARYSELESRMKKEMHQTEVAARARSLSRNGAYVTLGLRSGANIESIDDAYRRLSANYHPDKGGNLSKLYDIEAAYSVLKQGGGTRKRKRHIALRRARKTRRSRR
jgi:DnaJ-class molecular chaperone